MNFLISVLIWLIYFIPAIAIELVCYLLAPLVACFVTTKQRGDIVKRYDKEFRTMPRDYLQKYIYWFQTHDNAVDEWWYGMYNTDHWFEFARNWTQADYDSKYWVRWYCRLMWLWRNCAYGFHYNLFGQPKETQFIVWAKGIEGVGFWYQLTIFDMSFQLEMQVPLGPRYFSINIGWKAHKSMPRLLYANRIIGFRKY
jgi:hypothetical protein